jgi:hypothetical protein
VSSLGSMRGDILQDENMVAAFRLRDVIRLQWSSTGDITSLDTEGDIRDYRTNSHATDHGHIRLYVSQVIQVGHKPASGRNNT